MTPAVLSLHARAWEAVRPASPWYSKQRCVAGKTALEDQIKTPTLTASVSQHVRDVFESGVVINQSML